MINQELPQSLTSVDQLQFCSYQYLQKQLKVYRLKGLTSLKLNAKKEILIKELTIILTNFIQLERIKISEISEGLKLQEILYQDDLSEETFISTCQEYYKCCEKLARIISQVDNINNLEEMQNRIEDEDFSYSSVCQYFYDDVKKAEKYGLIEWDVFPVKTCAKQALAWVVNLLEKDSHYSSRDEIIRDAFKDDKLDVLWEMDFGKQIPIIPEIFWKEKIQSEIETLQKVNVVYTNPWGISRNIKLSEDEQISVSTKEFWALKSNISESWDEPLLQILFKIPTPYPTVSDVIFSAPNQYDPFYEDIKSKQEMMSKGLVAAFASKSGVFGSWENKQKRFAKNMLRNWLAKCLTLISVEELNLILQLFQTSYQHLMAISDIVFTGTCFEILGCAPHDSFQTIKTKWKALLKQYHPDISNDPQALEKTQIINKAFVDCQVYYFA